MATAAALVVLAAALLLQPGQAQESSSGRHGELQASHPHGLPFESPLALSPEAYEFFHPSDRAWRGHVAPALAPRAQLRGSVLRGDGASAASVARADQEEGGVAPVKQSLRGGAARAGAVASVLVGAAVVVAAALVLAYAVARRRVAHGDAVAAGASKSNACRRRELGRGCGLLL